VWLIPETLHDKPIPDNVSRKPTIKCPRDLGYTNILKAPDTENI